jgi:hypothetical protein
MILAARVTLKGSFDYYQSKTVQEVLFSLGYTWSGYVKNFNRAMYQQAPILLIDTEKREIVGKANLCDTSVGNNCDGYLDISYLLSFYKVIKLKEESKDHECLKWEEGDVCTVVTDKHSCFAKGTDVVIHTPFRWDSGRIVGGLIKKYSYGSAEFVNYKDIERVKDSPTEIITLVSNTEEKNEDLTPTHEYLYYEAQKEHLVTLLSLHPMNKTISWVQSQEKISNGTIYKIVSSKELTTITKEDKLNFRIKKLLSEPFKTPDAQSRSIVALLKEQGLFAE